MPKKNKGKKNEDEEWNDEEAEKKIAGQMEDLAVGDTDEGDKNKKKKVNEGNRK
jgi:hypothetical protein